MVPSVLRGIIRDGSKWVGLDICESIAPNYFETAEDGSMRLRKDQFDEADRLEVEAAV